VGRAVGWWRGRAVWLAQGPLRRIVADRTTVLGEMMRDPDRGRAKRVAEAMLQMVKLDIAGLKEAYDGG
jgi:hypothetical protein